MSKNKAPTLVRQIDQSLRSRLAIGRAKRPDKIDGSYRKYIYSWQTYRSYMKQLGLFARWCKDIHGARYVKECRQYVAEYMQTRKNLSVWTQKLDLAALQKLYQEYPKDGQNRSELRCSLDCDRTLKEVGSRPPGTKIFLRVITRI